jgi:hypothetical protein
MRSMYINSVVRIALRLEIGAPGPVKCWVKAPVDRLLG